MLLEVPRGCILRRTRGLDERFRDLDVSGAEGDRRDELPNHQVRSGRAVDSPTNRNQRERPHEFRSGVEGYDVLVQLHEGGDDDEVRVTFATFHACAR
jgi:hypothetical protein